MAKKESGNKTSKFGETSHRLIHFGFSSEFEIKTQQKIFASAQTDKARQEVESVRHSKLAKLNQINHKISKLFNCNRI